MSKVTVGILGGSLTGNKGAASMVCAVADGVRARFDQVEIRIFSPFPSQDRTRTSGAVVAFRPVDMLLRFLPAALLSLVTLRRLQPRRGPARQLSTADVVADVSGIAFMDGRGLPTLVYNVLLIFLPWAFGVPVIKMAQALGPFHDPLNRVAAKTALGMVTWIGLRGEETARNVQPLGLRNAESAADVAFLMEVGPEAERAASLLLPEIGHTILVIPSAVVERACRPRHIDYVGLMAHLIDGLALAGHEVTLVAHSARSDGAESHINDLPVCARIAGVSSARLIDDELDARQLRALIGRSKMVITSRFHAMVSALATVTPVLVVGWSHKYEEVLAEFGLEHWAVDFQNLDDGALLGTAIELVQRSGEYRAAVIEHLPQVRADALRNLDRLGQVIESRRR